MIRLYIIMCAVALAGCTFGREERPNDASLVDVGDRMPEFSIGDLDSPADFVGKKSMLVLFYRGCGDCQNAMPVIVDAASQCPYLQVVTVERGAPDSDNPYPALPNYHPDPMGGVYYLFAEHTVPRVYLIDETATIRYQAIERLPENFKQKIDEILY